MLHQTLEAAAVRRSRAGLAPALLLLGGLVLAAPAQAGPILTPIPTDGALRGMPGDTVGWGFVLSNDEHYLFVTGATFSASPTIGSFTDLIGPQNLVIGPDPVSDSVTQTFDPLLWMTGLGAFEIDRFAPIGGLATGLLTLTYDLYPRSPNDADFDPNDYVSLDNQLGVMVSVGVPAPGPLLLVLTGLLGFLRRNRPDFLRSSRPR